MSGVATRGIRLGAAGSPRRLQDVAVEVRPGELLAVIGASGTGKSTLLEVLAGLLRPAAAEGTVGGVPVRGPAATRAGRVGYVPQGDALHPELSVGAELRFAAELRTPREDPVDAGTRVRAVLAALDLAPLAGRRIGALSGGERRRVSVALELLAAPEVLLLDEATTGLDAAHERDVVQYLRRLADSGRAVVLTTHSVVQLEQFDRVLLLGSAGRVLFAGTPAAALAASGARSYVDLLDRAEPFGPPPPDRSAPAAPPPPPHRRTGGARVLARRELARLAADRRTLALIALQAPLLGLLVRELAGSGGLAPGAVTTNLYARRTVLTLVLCAVWLGSLNAVRAVVGERAVIRRERVAGVRPGEVLAAKSAVLLLLTGGQALVLTVVALAGLPAGYRSPVLPGVLPAVALGLWLCGLAAGCLALAVSAFARSSDRALALLPLLLVPQLVLSGGVVALRDVPALRAVSYVSSARWGFSAAASATHLRDLESRTAVPVPISPVQRAVARHEDADRGWDPTPAAWAGDLAALAALAALGLALAARGLRRV